MMGKIGESVFAPCRDGINVNTVGAYKKVRWTRNTKTI